VTTVPGFSSRTAHVTTVKQFPHRDEAIMESNTPGWSNSDPDDPSRTVVTAEVGGEVVESPSVVTVNEPTAPTKAVRKAPAKKAAPRKAAK